MTKGYFTLGRWRGAPVRVHWTAPIGAVVFGHFQFVPAFWLGFFLLVVIHEMGHAQVVRMCRQRVLSVDVHAMGGFCRWSGEVTPIQRACIAWGGIWAQIVLLLLTLFVLVIVGSPSTAFGLQIVDAFTVTNLWLMAFNLVPMPPLDGANAWPLVGILFRRWKLEWRVMKAAREARMQKDRAEHAAQAEVDQLEKLEEAHENDEADETTKNEAKDLLDRISEDIKRDREKTEK